MAKKLAKRGKDNAYPPLMALSTMEEKFTKSVRKLLGTGWSLSFTQDGDEYRAVAASKEVVLYGAGKTINESLANLILEYFLQDKKTS